MKDVRVTIPGLGAVRGQTHDGIDTFKGVPYAAPPVGPLRWRPPAPQAPWSETLVADRFGPGCLQVAPAGHAMDETCDYAEDCLYLNIWRPVSANPTGLPVMVWIHGGGFAFGTGASPITDGAALARRGVIVITINYRLGRFGWFAHPELTREAAGQATANFGLMDQIAALHWVQEHIAAFGGDPGNVTVFGVSAGARSVQMMMSAPAARGLFSKAIAQTSGPRMRCRDLATAETYGSALADALGVPDLAALRAAAPDAVLALDMPEEHETAPILDGVLIAHDIDDAFERGLQAPIPHLLGSNDYEASNFLDLMPPPDEVLAGLPEPLRQAVLDVYGATAGDDASHIVAGMVTDQICTEPARFVADRHARTGQPVFRYLFGYVPQGLVTERAGAGHGEEQPYVFGTLDAVSRWRGVVTDVDRARAEDIGRYWTNFAKTGDPNGPGLPQWPADGADTLLRFAPDGPAPEHHFWRARLDLWAQVASAN